VFATLATVACSSALPEPVLAERPASELVEVPYPPPPARVEHVPTEPERAAVWIDGEWEWDGRRWAWRYGGWIAAPSEGISLAKWVTVRRTDGALMFAPSLWRDATGHVVPSPAMLAPATADDDSVISPEGNRESTAPNVQPGSEGR
jgi:hypothetical protein